MYLNYIAVFKFRKNIFQIFQLKNRLIGQFSRFFFKFVIQSKKLIYTLPTAGKNILTEFELK